MRMSCHWAVLGMALGLASCSPTHPLSHTEATEFLDRYTAALATADTSEIYPFWSRRSLTRPGFDYMHVWIGAAIPLADWPRFLQEGGFRAVLDSVRSVDDYRILECHWRQDPAASPEPAAPPRRMRYYLVPEGGEWRLINPIDLLTTDWNTHESECFIFHHAPDVPIADHRPEIRLMDSWCHALQESLGLGETEKLHYYHGRTPIECGELISFPPQYGYCVQPYPHRPSAPQWYDVLIASSFTSFHEAVHLMAVRAGLYTICAGLDEGLAVALGGGTLYAPALAEVRARQFLDAGRVPPMRELWLDDARFMQTAGISYHASGSFVRFLIDRFGFEALRTFWTGALETQDLAGACEHAYGATLDALDARWRRHLQASPVPRVQYSAPVSARRILSLEDPAGDDRGDGDYSYPTAPGFTPGMCDLTGFEVSCDEENAYFRLRFRDLPSVIAGPRPQLRYSAGALIAIRKGAANGRDLLSSAEGLRFPADGGCDLMIRIGFAVTVLNAARQIVFSTLESVEELLDTADGSMAFALPCELIGVPDEDWRFFVGTGIERATPADISYAGFVGARAQAQPFAPGGGEAGSAPSHPFFDVLLPEEVDQEAVLRGASQTGELKLVP